MWSILRRLFGGSTHYALVWREHTNDGAVMKAELYRERSDEYAVAEARSRFHERSNCDWVFWCLFRPDDSLLRSEQGPKIRKWHGDFNAITADTHVLHTLQAVRRDRKPVIRPLHRVKLQGRSPPKNPGSAQR